MRVLDCLSRAKLEDLEFVEREQYGAEAKALMRFGADYMNFVEISALGPN